MAMTRRTSHPKPRPLRNARRGPFDDLFTHNCLSTANFIIEASKVFLIRFGSWFLASGFQKHYTTVVRPRFNLK